MWKSHPDSGALLSQGLNDSFQGCAVRTENPINQSIIGEANRLTALDRLHSYSLGHTILEEDKGWHGRDTVPPSDVLDVVNIDLGEGETALDSVAVSQLGKDGRNGAAWRTPVSVEVDNDIGGGG